ncbi:MAG: preprotein translocase subunit SecE [Deltaproteobacteria bacterium]|nr:preprotein translocase subunit SecE [Deltaproteobacteria bacterium]
MNLQRFVNIAYVLAGLLAWVICAHLFGAIFDLFSRDFDRPLIGTEFARSDLLGLICGAAVGVALKLNRVVNTWALEVANELKKVTWPSWEETRLSTVVVIITSIVMAIILGVFDMIWALVSTAIYSLG